MLTISSFCLAQVEFFGGQVFVPADMAVIGLLLVLEGVLSIDNALVLGLLAKRLPPSQRKRALSYGLIGAFVFRFLAIATATFLLQWTWVKLLGGAYLLYIALKHLLFESQEDEADQIDFDAQGEPILVVAETGQPISAEREVLEITERVPFPLSEGAGSVLEPASAQSVSKAIGTPATAAVNLRKFWWTVFVIELTDIAFAVDSIVAAIGVVGSPPAGTPASAPHPKLWVVILGGFLGVVLMRFAAVLFIKLLDRFPRFETAAYLLVSIIGLKLLLDWGLNGDWASFGWTGNVEWAHAYLGWLKEYWIFRLPAESYEHPHLIDFHDLRRPECIVFWLSMILAFCVGFLPKRIR
jgi:YkoY family integral membrane protein